MFSEHGGEAGGLMDFYRRHFRGAGDDPALNVDKKRLSQYRSESI